MDIFAPWPGMEEPPAYVSRYEECEWKGPNMCLLEFLRKSNAEGKIVQWVERKWKTAQKAGSTDSLEEFARACACEGEKAVAAGCVSRLRDRFYGQWLTELRCNLAATA